MNRVFAPSDALKCSEILMEKMAAASVSHSAIYRTAHKILSMSSVRRTPQFVLDYIRGSVSQLDGKQGRNSILLKNPHKKILTESNLKRKLVLTTDLLRFLDFFYVLC